MKIPHIVIISTVLILPTMATATPNCTGNCKNYTWNTTHNAFICATGTCQCTSTTTYPCWNPCNEHYGCNTTQWNETITNGIQTGTVYQCQLDTSTGLCNITTRSSTRCAPGYYDPSQGASGSCTSCAEATNNPSATSPHTSFSISACYVPANTEFAFSDTTGTGIAYFETDCKYTQ